MVQVTAVAPNVGVVKEADEKKVPTLPSTRA